uniref:RING zinc finger protein-like n=1 Tax=Zea mays TaxID=4577 RepID=B6TIB7_MAIZE|nr:RING zinc finger protein-like [Zea mays]
MWSFASNAIAGSLKKKAQPSKCSISNADYSDDEVSSCTSREEGLDCPICWESFNLVENVPYVLWCGHTMCKNCILGLHWAVVKFPSLPIQLPLFISCPWCNLLSFRLVYKGNLRFPRKNYFLLWMVESMNGGRQNSIPLTMTSIIPRGIQVPAQAPSHQQRRNAAVGSESSSGRETGVGRNIFHTDNISASLQKLMVCFMQLTAKFPLVIIFLLIVLYAVPASAAVLVLYALVTFLFALPSFLILYFAYPSLDWLVREIFA